MQFSGDTSAPPVDNPRTQILPGDPLARLQPYLPALCFLVAGVAHLAVNQPHSAFQVVFAAGAGLLLVGAGVTIDRSRVAPTHYRRLLGWSATGTGLVGVVIAALLLSPTVQIDSVPSIIAGLGIGALFGLAIGFNEAKAIERGREAERERLHAERTEAENDRLEHLNHLLRHDILNNVTVIQMYRRLLEEQVADTNRAYVEKIGDQADAIEELIGNVRAYLDAVEDDEQLRAVDASETLRAELSTLEQSYPDATVTADVPGGVRVRADDLLGTVFTNLLRNAVVHNPASNPEVDVGLVANDQTVTVRIRDDGPGIPPGEREALFEKPTEGNHGFGLYLVQTFVDRYGGQVRLESTGENGTTFAVVLPRATVVDSQ